MKATLHQHHPHTFSFPQVFLMGLVFVVLLRVLMSLIWIALGNVNPAQFHMAYLTADSIPWPLFILGVPLVLAVIIIAFSGPHWERRHTWSNPHSYLQDDRSENDHLFSPRYTPQEVFNIIKVISFIWLGILMLQLVSWIAFSSYAL